MLQSKVGFKNSSTPVATNNPMCPTQMSEERTEQVEMQKSIGAGILLPLANATVFKQSTIKSVNYRYSKINRKIQTNGTNDKSQKVENDANSDNNSISQNNISNCFCLAK